MLLLLFGLEEKLIEFFNFIIMTGKNYFNYLFYPFNQGVFFNKLYIVFPGLILIFGYLCDIPQR